ncbi:sulfurtransferase-like selenium metabolism protein YedF [Sedimentibacter sp. MB31-C6]|uniref:sulfurtransferase-like selenium metabolism protein YedF n=1 Tax=Sedimentibacter sp. MB31-C6 TaxID=3109366 RepID=UPI002DDD729B|nr:sulfurtransferase-like selenium metabolism protein YedF [Sedimentibacter sp. MB36-C1]WSI05477.1 sulfurtransferase-like selenium metabolism protein YedF [Sedimentibacter sp. MB36-C1]
MKTIDARGKSCPLPVILTKKEIDAGENNIITIVDNETAKLNVGKLASKFAYNTKLEEKNDGIYIELFKETNVDKDIEIVDNSTKINSCIVLGSDKLGKGSEELGNILMKSFIYTITETKPYPNFMVFLNSGVKLTTKGSEVIEDLKKLVEEGVKIVSCGTCLDFFEIKGNLEVGEISNMYDIVEMINNSDNTITV